MVGVDVISEVEFLYNNFGNILVCNEIEDISNNPIGYCTKIGDVYKVYHYNKFDDDYLNEVVLKHEYGHIYLGHLSSVHENSNKNLTSIIRNNFDDLVNLINANCGIDYGSSLLKKVIHEPIYNKMVHNIAADLEVNSTILSIDDIRSLELAINNIKFNESDNSKMKSTIKLMHPSD